MSDVTSEKVLLKVLAMSKLAWLLVTEYGACIYGGFARDMVLNGADFSCLFEWVKHAKSIKHIPNDLDIFVRTRGSRPKNGRFTNFVRDEGFTIMPADNSEGSERECLRYVIGLINADLITGNPVEFTIDVSFKSELPPFGRIDFECNSLMWSRDGVYFNANCGTPDDRLSFLDRKVKEAEIARHMTVMQTIMIVSKIPHPGDPMHLENVEHRQRFVCRIVKMWNKGWDIVNLELRLTSEATDAECYICREVPTIPHIKMSCCKGVMHIDCFGEYANKRLAERLTIPCPGTPDTTWNFFN